jgi:hypothetical protein
MEKSMTTFSWVSLKAFYLDQGKGGVQEYLLTKSPHIYVFPKKEPPYQLRKKKRSHYLGDRPGKLRLVQKK